MKLLFPVLFFAMSSAVSAADTKVFVMQYKSSPIPNAAFRPGVMVVVNDSDKSVTDFAIELRIMDSDGKIRSEKQLAPAQRVSDTLISAGAYFLVQPEASILSVTARPMEAKPAASWSPTE